MSKMEGRYVTLSLPERTCFSFYSSALLQVLSMKKTNYKDSYGDGFIEEVAKVMCGGESGSLAADIEM